jgi:hypothetical protein
MRVKKKEPPKFDFAKEKLASTEEFCNKCKNKSTREMQNTVNRLFGTLKLIAPHLNADDNDWEKMCDKVAGYAHGRDKLSARIEKATKERDTKEEKFVKKRRKRIK